MKTSIPKITNVVMKEGGAKLYLLPQVEPPEETNDPSVVMVLENALEFAIDQKVNAIVVCMVMDDGIVVCQHGGVPGATMLGALDLAKASIMGELLDV